MARSQNWGTGCCANSWDLHTCKWLVKSKKSCTSSCIHHCQLRREPVVCSRRPAWFLAMLQPAGPRCQGRARLRDIAAHMALPQLGGVGREGRHIAAAVSRHQLPAPRRSASQKVTLCITFEPVFIPCGREDSC